MLIVPERHVLEMHTYMIIAYRSTATGTKVKIKKTQLFTFNLKNTDGWVIYVLILKIYLSGLPVLFFPLAFRNLEHTYTEGRKCKDTNSEKMAVWL